MKKLNQKNNPSSELKTFVEHLEELRLRFFSIILLLVITSILGYIFHPQIIRFLTLNFDEKLYFTSPAGGFNFALKVGITAGFICVVPFITYQFIKFFEPAISEKNKNIVIKLTLFSYLLLILGVLFAYFVILPASLNFLNQFAIEGVDSIITTNEYFDFVTIYIVGFALIFQLPILLLLINRFITLDPKKILQKQKFIIILCLIISAILTPTPDPFNQILVAVPILLLFYFSIVLVWYINNKKRRLAVGE